MGAGTLTFFLSIFCRMLLFLLFGLLISAEEIGNVMETVEEQSFDANFMATDATEEVESNEQPEVVFVELDNESEEWADLDPYFEETGADVAFELTEPDVEIVSVEVESSDLMDPELETVSLEETDVTESEDTEDSDQVYEA